MPIAGSSILFDIVGKQEKPASSSILFDIVDKQEKPASSSILFDIVGAFLPAIPNFRLFDPIGDAGPASITNGTAVTATDTANLGERMLYDPSGGTFTLNAPASPAIGNRWAVKNRSSDITAITISGNGSSIEDPTSSFSLAASFSLSGDGISTEWEYDGTQWLAI